MTDTERSRRGRNSKSRAKTYEREVARKIGGTRHKADTGGPEDVEHSELAVQVKSGLAVVTQAMREGMAAAQAAAVGKNKLPVVALVDRKGTRLGWWLCFEMDQWAAWHGYGGNDAEGGG